MKLFHILRSLTYVAISNRTYNVKHDFLKKEYWGEGGLGMRLIERSHVYFPKTKNMTSSKNFLGGKGRGTTINCKKPCY